MFARSVRAWAGVGRRAFSSGAIRSADFTHAIIGGGAVGLSIARQLQARDGSEAILIERHGEVGTETSSRNSEVIHAGLYYGADSLKTRLCLRGKELMYELCEKNGIPHSNCGKWIVAQDDQQMEAITSIHEFAKTIGVPTHFITREHAAILERDVRCHAGALVSPSTGIVDSHSLMQYLQGSFESLGGTSAFNTPVTRITPLSQGSQGWKITTLDPSTSQETTITASTVINSAGLAAIPLSNSILPESRRIQPAYAKGSYFSYSSSHPSPKTLVYPAPRPGHGGLGTHLTLDMAGKIRFGPDVEWIDSPEDLKPSPTRLAEALEDIKAYLPSVDVSAIGLDYAGIRPKLSRGGGVADVDFYIKKENGFEGWVNLLGIESPGLTSCLAIGEEVERILYGGARSPLNL